MQWLKVYTTKVQSLVALGTLESLTYAALECRLALERVCYERLRMSHDYIPHKDIRRWPPKHVIDLLISDVNELAATDFTLSISKKPVNETDRDLDATDFEGFEYVPIGRQVGFDPKLIGSLWQGLSSFLHVKLPKTSSDELATYGNLENLTRKVAEALVELTRLQEGTLVSSGLGETVSFVCKCGSANKRRQSLVQQNQRLSCINPSCNEKYRAEFADDGSIWFERVQVPIPCRECNEIGYFPEHDVVTLGLNRTARYLCGGCGAENQIKWSLMQARTDGPG